jgi:[ribosomal protein S5]-alanine N-acetyltransferase
MMNSNGKMQMRSSHFSIKTTNLLLRDLQPDDFEAFFATTNEPEFREYYPEHETTRPFLQDVFNHILAASQETNRMKYQLGICLPSGKLIGTCGVRIEDIENRQASFGCAVARDYWGNSFAYEASHAIIDFAFSSLPVRRVFAETNADNQRARRLAERLGMRQEALLKEIKFFRDRWWDTAVYAVLKDEWGRRAVGDSPTPVAFSITGEAG